MDKPDLEQLKKMAERQLRHKGCRGFFVAEGIKIPKDAKPNEDGWLLVKCIFHDDTNPSLGINLKTGAWNCHAGCGHGSFFDFIAKRRSYAGGYRFQRSVREVCKLVGLDDNLWVKKEETRIVQESSIEKWQAAMTDEHYALLYKSHGLHKATLQKYHVGVVPPNNPGAIKWWYTMSIRDAAGTAVCVRLRSDKAGKRFMTGFDNKTKWLCGVDELVKENWSTVVLCAGETDRMRFMQERDSKDIGAVCGIHGENVFNQEWIEHFKGRRVVVIYDVDKPGLQALQRSVLPALEPALVAKDIAELGVVTLDIKGEGNDLCDYFSTHSMAELRKLIDSAVEYKPRDAETIKTPSPIPIRSLSQIDDPALIDKLITVPVVASGDSSVTYHSVLSFRVASCPMMEKERGCNLCRDRTYDIKLSAPFHLQSCNSSESEVKKMCLRRVCRQQFGKVPPVIEILQKATLRECVCEPVRERGVLGRRMGNEEDSGGIRIVYVHIPDEKALHIRPQKYIATGWVRTHPKTSQATLLVKSLKPEPKEYKKYDWRANKGLLDATRKLGVQGILDQLAKHVTRLYGVPELHLAVLLAYCSALDIDFNKERIRGWLNVAIVGDTGTGKTYCYSKISEWLGIGDVFSALSGRRTGLTYAVVSKRRGAQWSVQFGRHPLNHGEILFAEEVQQLAPEDISALAESMEGGWLQVDRVASGGCESKTRLVMCANPPRGQSLSDLDYGCRALRHLFLPMFIRRLDLCLFMATAESGAEQYNRLATDNEKPLLTPDMLKGLVYYAWNLTPERVVIDMDTTKAIIEAAKTLSAEFGEDKEVPLLHQADCRKTVARLSVACAVLSLSSTDEYETISVTPHHVGTIVSYLQHIYRQQVCGLRELAVASRKRRGMGDYDVIKKELEKGVWDKKTIFDNFRAGILRLLSIGGPQTKQKMKDYTGASMVVINEFVDTLCFHNLVDTIGGKKHILTQKGRRVLERFIEDCPEAEPIIFNVDEDANGIEGKATQQNNLHGGSNGPDGDNGDKERHENAATGD